MHLRGGHPASLLNDPRALHWHCTSLAYSTNLICNVSSCMSPRPGKSSNTSLLPVCTFLPSRLRLQLVRERDWCSEPGPAELEPAEHAWNLAGPEPATAHGQRRCPKMTSRDIQSGPSATFQDKEYGDDSLVFYAGMLITVLPSLDADGWAYGRLARMESWFPL